MTELPESITRLQGLLKLQIEYNGKTSIRCAPMQISTLPCWTNTEKPYRCNWKISESLQKLKVSKFHHESIRDVSSLISKWRACNSIDLSSNEIATLPDSMSTLTDLCHINLSRNTMTVFPDVLLQMTWLTFLDISENPVRLQPLRIATDFYLISIYFSLFIYILID
eukprot:TRINITY_DN10732_c0_g1_i8.p1 TRINITY_DN10732_c0_g1~~TRINITY_DN10732_c0_g1_i8.p1  ORF type:complete len:167 (+),score=25.80 TRINITY_DN10732_c0_g1_i8:1002-1502(+)